MIVSKRYCRLLLLLYLTFGGINSVFCQSLPDNPNVTDQNGLRQGKWTITYTAEGRPTINLDSIALYRIADFKNDLPTDTVRDYYISGQILRKAILLKDKPNDLPDGKVTWYHENGAISAIEEYSAGVLNGLSQTFHPNQVLAHEANYDNGNRQGVLIWYDSLGRKTDDATYSAGVVSEFNNFYENGGLKIRYKYEKGEVMSTIYFNRQAEELEEWKTLNSAGLKFYKSGKYKQAATHFSNAAQRATLEFGEEDARLAQSLNNLGEAYKKLSQWQKAEEAHLNALSIRMRIYGDQHQVYAVSLNNLGQLYQNLGDYENAEQMLVQSKEIRLQHFGKDHLKYAVALSSLASLYRDMGLYSKAEPLLKQAFEINESQREPNDPEYALAMNNLAAIYKAQGHYVKAEPLYKKALKIEKKALGDTHPRYARTLNNLGSLYDELGLFDKSEDLFKQSLMITEKTQGNKHPNYAQTLNNLALLYLDQGNFAKSERLFKESIQIREERFGTSHQVYAKSLNNLSTLFIYEGQYEKAEKQLIASTNLLKNSLGQDHPNYLTALNNLAYVYRRQGKFLKAEKVYKDIIKLRKQKLGTNHPDYARSVNNLAALYLIQDLDDQALPLLLESKEIRKKVYGNKHPEYAQSLNNLAHLLKEDFAKAEPLFKEALHIKKETFGDDHEEYAHSLNNLAAFYKSHGLYEKAEPLYLEANNILINEIDQNFIHLSEKEKSAYFSTFSHKFEIFQSFINIRYPDNPSIVADNFNNVLATKGLLFRSIEKMKNTILESGDTTTIELFNAWRLQRTFLASLYAKSPAERRNINVDVNQEELKADELEKQLALKSEVFNSSANQKRYTWKDVRNKLNENEAAVELIRFRYYLTEWTDSVLYAAMIVKPDTKQQPEWVVLPNGNEIEGTAFEAYRNKIKFKLKDDASYNVFWKTISENLEGIKKVYLSADGVYHSISLEGLYNQKTQAYLSDELDIIRITSTRDLIEVTSLSSTNTTVELMGYPAYNLKINDHQEKEIDRSISNLVEQDAQTRFFNGQDIPMLPGTKKEVESMQGTLEKSGYTVNTYLSNSATEEAVKKWHNPRIAHIATHGYFLKDKDVEQEEFSIAGIERNTLIQNPLLRSGLLFANAKQAFKSGGDGILTGYEARDLNLDETELVVLSACETGLGEIKNGEGVYGLQRAFQEAGAQTIIMSLWTVSDEATQKLMTQFYDNWLIQKMPKRQAFKSAKNQLRQAYDHPYYWAAFVMMGN